MRGIPNDFMKVGLVHFMAFPQCSNGEGPVLDTVSAVARDLFFDAVEVTQVRSPLLRHEIRAVLDESRVEGYFGAQPILLGSKLDLNHPSPIDRQRAIKAVKWGAEQALEMGCKAIAVLSGPVSDDREVAKERLVDSLRQICAYAAPKNLRVVLETFDQAAYGKNCLIGPTAEAAAISQELRKDYPDFGLLLDLSHLPLLHETAEAAISAAGDHLVHVHIGNCAMDDPDHPAYGDNHPRFGAPGTRNDIPELTAFLHVLLKSGYLSETNRRVVSFEIRPLPGEEPLSVLAGSKRTLMAAWRNL